MGKGQLTDEAEADPSELLIGSNISDFTTQREPKRRATSFKCNWRKKKIRCEGKCGRGKDTCQYDGFGRCSIPADLI